MKKIFLFFISVLLIFSHLFCEELSYRLDRSELPIYETEEQRELIIHKGYVLSYREMYEQPEFVMYVLNYGNSKVSRSNDFKPDYSVSTKSATPQDYYKSGYDKGHLAPAADFSYSKELMSESFYMSNMSPQTPGLNRGPWKFLEEYFRNLGEKYDKVYIITGPVLGSDDTSDSFKEIGENKVKIPYLFYKCGLFIKDNEYYMISFLMPNEIISRNFEDYQCNTDYIETLVEMDFFAFLNDEIEESLESYKPPLK
jgi:endonuclease G